MIKSLFVVVVTQATDLDTDVLVYTIIQDAASAKFVINQSTGWIETNGLFIEDTIGAVHEFRVLVKDNGGNMNYSEDTSTVKVRIYFFKTYIIHP